MIQGKTLCVNKNLSVFTFNITDSLATSNSRFVDQGLDNLKERSEEDAE